MGLFDLSFKALFDRLPMQTLSAFGARPVTASAKLEAIQRELSVPLKAVDAATIVTQNGERWIEHFESEVGYADPDPWEIRRRALVLELKYDLPVYTTVILMSRRRSPPHPPASIGGRRGTLTLMLEPRYVRLWEEPPDKLLGGGAPLDALPWVAAMRATPEQEEMMIRRILAVLDEDLRSKLTAEVVALAGLKYDKNRAEELRQRIVMATTKEILMASFVGEELVEYGIEKGREEGREERLGSIRRHIRSLLRSRKVSAPVAWLDEVKDPNRLDDLFDALLAASDNDQLMAALTAFRRE